MNSMKRTNMHWGGNAARFFFLALTIGLVTSTILGATELSGDLDPRDDAAVYEGYAYGVYEIEASGERLSVSMNASGLDTYLILRSPEERFQTNDDGGKGNNAKIEISEPDTGTWIAIATSYGRSAHGPYSVVIEGATHVSRADPEDLDAKLIEAAFSARGVLSQAQVQARREEERNRMSQILREQLTLPSFRAELIENLRKEMVAETPTERDFYSRYEAQEQELEARKRALEAALREVDSLKMSQDLIGGLLEEEVESLERSLAFTRGFLSRRSEAIEERAEKREAFAAALEELIRLDESALALLRLEENLFDSGGREGAGIRQILLEITRLRATIDELAGSIVARLLESSDFQRLFLAFGQAGRRLGISADERGASAALLVDSLIDGAIDSANLDPPIDPSVWLPELFPWPPPEASSRVVLGRNLIPAWQSRTNTLGEVDDTLNEALLQAGYSGPSYFGVKNGFALITQLEQTNADGVPLDGVARWSTSIVEMKAFSLVEYLRALLTAPAGYYRLLAFITTSDPFAATGTRGRFATIERWSRVGHNHLPEAVRAMPFTDDHRVTVLIYEFLKERPEEEPFTSLPGRFTARQHLERSGLLVSLR